VVRLQVSLLPWARREPYDAYADISFFRGDFPRHRIFPGDQVQETGYVRLNTGKDGAPFLNKNPELSNGRTSQKDVRVLPLLVTDDVEAAIEARSLDRVRQIAFALSVAIKGVGLQSNLEKMTEQLESVSSLDYNSAFTVARVSENTLRVRFGALNQAQAQYAVIPQAHNVTLLLMVPTNMVNKNEISERTVRLVSRTAFIDARDGTELEDNSQYRVEAIQKVLQARKIEATSQ